MAVVETSPDDFDDWPALLSLLRRCFAFMQGRIAPPSSLDVMTADDLREKAALEHLLLVRDGGRLAACAYAAVRPDVVYVGKVAVHPAWRGRGLARQLMDAAEAVARANGRAALELQTRIELVENHATFRALGFHEVARTAHPGHDQPTSVTMRCVVSGTLADAASP